MKDIRFLTRWGFGLAFSLVALLHLIKPEFNIMTRHISEYANGQFGFIMILAFLFFAFGLLGLAFQSYRIISGIKLRVAISFLFLLSAFSSIILGLFPINLQDAPSNPSSLIHLQTAPILMLSMLMGLSFLTVRLKFETDYVKIFKTSAIFGVFTWLSLVVLFIFATDPDYQGLVQRIFALLIWSWLLFISLKLA
jgi:hypothetical protein